MLIKLLGCIMKNERIGNLYMGKPVQDDDDKDAETNGGSVNPNNPPN